MRVIGVTGQNGTGKDEVLKYISARYGVPFLATGDVVREIAAQEGVEPTRSNLQKISERYFQQYGQGYFVRLVAEKIKEKAWGVAGISGIRSFDDVQVLKTIFGKDFVLIHVFITDPHIRYERMSKRGEERDPHSYDEFLRNDAAEERIFHIKKAEQNADYLINNDGTRDDLHRQIDQLVSEKKLLTTERLRSP